MERLTHDYKSRVCGLKKSKCCRGCDVNTGEGTIEQVIKMPLATITCLSVFFQKYEFW